MRVCIASGTSSWYRLCRGRKLVFQTFLYTRLISPLERAGSVRHYSIMAVLWVSPNRFLTRWVLSLTDTLGQIAFTEHTWEVVLDKKHWLSDYRVCTVLEWPMAGGGKEQLWGQFGNQPIPHKQDLELRLSSPSRKKYKAIKTYSSVSGSDCQRQS